MSEDPAVTNGRRPAPRTAKTVAAMSGAGAGVDIFGGPVIDPTQNVRELVLAESKYQDAMRIAGERLASELAKAESRRVDGLAKAEQLRIDALADLRTQYDTRIAENLRIEVKTTSELISAQLAKETTSLSTQIANVTSTFSSQITALTASLTARLADLERFRWEVGGKTSVADPAVNATLAELTRSLEVLKTGQARATVTDPATADTLAQLTASIRSLEHNSKEVRGQTSGQNQIIAWIIAASSAMAAVAIWFAGHHG